jgi:hypothetical protein
MDGTRITRQELGDIIKDEVEKLKKELNDDLAHCFKSTSDAIGMSDCIGHSSELDDMEDRVRPEDDTDRFETDVINEKVPRKTMAQKAKTRKRQEDEKKRERFRKGVLGGEATMQTLGITEDEIEEEKKPRRNRKPGKKRKSCGPGNPYKNQDGKFTAPSSDRGSWAKKTRGPDCAHGQFKRKNANKATTYVKDCGRKGREQGTNILCKTGKPATFEEGWKSFLMEVQGKAPLPQQQVTQPKDALGAAIKKEMSEMFQRYEKWLSQTQKRALHNPEKLSDDKLVTHCNSFGWTTLQQYLQQTNAMNTLVNNVLGSDETQRSYTEPKSKAEDPPGPPSPPA